jgi:hypothetical protein
MTEDDVEAQGPHWLRDWFAGLAMQMIKPDRAPTTIAAFAYEMADAMLQARERVPKCTRKVPATDATDTTDTTDTTKVHTLHPERSA